MRKIATLVFAVFAVSLLATACAKKTPETTPAPAPPPPVQEAPPPPPPPPAPEPEPEPDPLAGEIAEVNRYVRDRGLLGDVHFDYDRSELKPEALDRLRKNAEFLQANPRFLVAIEGHCDERGTVEYNVALGQRRADAARAFLRDSGIDPSRIQVVSFGEERPVCTGSDESCWWRNRRAAFAIAGRR